jgi:hypothetical protein
MTPGIAALLDRLTDRKQVLLADLEDAASLKRPLPQRQRQAAH